MTQTGVRSPLTATTLRARGTFRLRPKPLSAVSPRVAPIGEISAASTPLSPRSKGTATIIAPPEQRLAAVLTECLRLDHELKIIESSGHARFGVFAKPFGDQQRCRMLAKHAKQETDQHLPEDPSSEATFIADDDVTNDPFFHRFFDENGQSTYEQLLRARMRALILSKMVYSRDSVQYARAEMELADTYVRMNLWKQAHTHVMVSYEVLKILDATRARTRKQAPNHVLVDPSDGNERVFGQLLSYFYEQQQRGDPMGEVVLADLVQRSIEWRSMGDETSPVLLSTVLQPSNLESLFGGAPFVHWQQLLLRMEKQSAIFQDFIRDLESVTPETLLRTLRKCFLQLDPSQFGVISVSTLLQSLDLGVQADPFTQIASEALSLHDVYASITWSELLLLMNSHMRRSLADGETTDPARDLRPRIKLFFGKFLVRKGQLDDAMRYLQAAITEQERLSGNDSSALVPFYLAMAELLSVRFKQLAIVAQQHVFEVADKWLKTAEGAQRVRTKTHEIQDQLSRERGKPVPRKEAETKAREELLKEYSDLSFVRPDTSVIEDAIEFCTRAWRLQDQAIGADHVTTASVHTALAQIQANRKDWQEAVRCYEKAVEIYEAACNGPVPASAWLKLEIAKLCHHQTQQYAQAGLLYDEVGSFFHSFALEFASSDSTRRESCAQAIEAWRQWVVLTTSTSLSSTMEQHRQILTKIHDATVDGFGEFALEAAESGKEIAQWLVKMGQLRQAERQLRTAWYVLESHFGPNDRRSRKARKELMELSSELKGAALDDKEDEHREWLATLM